MKKLLNCKAILALAICLAMFAGLTMTASAATNYSVPDCPTHHTQFGTYESWNCTAKAYNGTPCGGTVTKYVCKYSPSCIHGLIACDGPCNSYWIF